MTSINQSACRWRCCSSECPPSCSVLWTSQPWRETKIELAQIFLHHPQPGMSWTPGRCLQFLGVGDMQACRSREWSWDYCLPGSLTWPNNLRCLVRTVEVRTVSDSSGCPVRLYGLRNSSQCSNQVIFRMRQRQHRSKASILFSIALVSEQVLAPYSRVGKNHDFFEKKSRSI